MNTHQWLGVAEVHQMLGGLIGLHEVRRLMKENHIVSFWIRGKLATSRKNVENWMMAVEQSHQQARRNGAKYITPVKNLQC